MKRLLVAVALFSQEGEAGKAGKGAFLAKWGQKKTPAKRARTELPKGKQSTTLSPSWLAAMTDHDLDPS